MNLDEVLEYIMEADGKEIPQILDEVLFRYKVLYPDWSLSVVSIEKKGDKKEQLDQMIALLENMKEK